MKKLKLKLEGKEMLSKDQLKKISGGYYLCTNTKPCSIYANGHSYDGYCGTDYGNCRCQTSYGNYEPTSYHSSCLENY